MSDMRSKLNLKALNIARRSLTIIDMIRVSLVLIYCFFYIVYFNQNYAFYTIVMSVFFTLGDIGNDFKNRMKIHGYLLVSCNILFLISAYVQSSMLLLLSFYTILTVVFVLLAKKYGPMMMFIIAPLCISSFTSINTISFFSTQIIQILLNISLASFCSFIIKFYLWPTSAGLMLENNKLSVDVINYGLQLSIAVIITITVILYFNIPSPFTMMIIIISGSVMNHELNKNRLMHRVIATFLGIIISPFIIKLVLITGSSFLILSISYLGVMAIIYTFYHYSFGLCYFLVTFILGVMNCMTKILHPETVMVWDPFTFYTMRLGQVLIAVAIFYIVMILFPVKQNNGRIIE
ncbi:hypothetical protein CF386_08915 [Paraphotobacterium marinum]|uniref:FUSC family protein n=1 Tax=Paraphotobacterium marinum TaxID=1755811 RepID=A0A220VFV2_9GAMM|nr:hypothetical protein [Paraphotobacterium marinum]ASK79181.1 hypothetical protein CF386_08915 [Paraphotobacterium marinum]